METSQLRSFSLAAFLAAGSLTAGQLYADPSIVNGSFEDPAEAPGTITNVKTVTVPGWFGSSLGSEYIVAGNYDDYGTTAFGSQYLGLNGFRIGAPSVESQAVTGFSAGTTYAFTFYLADLNGASNPTVVLDLTTGTDGDGDLLDEQIYTAPVGGPAGSGATGFVPFTEYYTPTQDTDITFSIRSASNGLVGIDNVSLTAVPEPTSATVTLLGTGAFACWTVRRRAQRG